MNLKPVQIHLESAQVKEVLKIALDDDADLALDFVKNVLFRQIEKALQRH